MFDKQLERLTCVLVEEEKCSAENKEVIAYGMSAAVELLINVLNV